MWLLVAGLVLWVIAPGSNASFYNACGIFVARVLACAAIADVRVKRLRGESDFGRVESAAPSATSASRAS